MGLSLGIDLGNDSLKLTYISDKAGSKFKDLTNDGESYRSLVRFDQKKNIWYFANEINKDKSGNYTTVVKITSLLDLLNINNKNYKINKDYFYNKKHFPKFYFPYDEIGKNFSFNDLVNKEMTFTSPLTPSEVVRDYFIHIAKKLFNTIYDKVSSITLIVDKTYGDEYINFLTSVVENAFNAKVNYQISGVKAISMFAYKNGYIKNDEAILIFEMSDTKIEVTKTEILDGEVVVDGNAGHIKPLDLGGEDIDKALYEYLYNLTLNSETLGFPSSDQGGHLFEKILFSKQYLLMEDIKLVKHLLSLPLDGNSLFKNGVPIEIIKDVYIQRKITKQEFLDVVKDEIYNKIKKYMVKEITSKINFDVKNVFVTGGMSKSYGLLDYLKKEIEGNCNVKINIFKENNITSSGACYIAYNNINIPTTLSLSYGTSGYLINENNPKDPHYLELAIKGTKLKKGKNKFLKGYSLTFDNLNVLSSAGHIEYFSTPFSINDKNKKRAEKTRTLLKYNGLYDEGKGYIFIGDKNTSNPITKKYRNNAVEAMDLKNVTKKEIISYRFKYNNREIVLMRPNYNIVIIYNRGFVIDEDGNAEIYIENNREANHNKLLFVYYRDDNSKPFVIDASQIEFYFPKEFKTELDIKSN